MKLGFFILFLIAVVLASSLWAKTKSKGKKNIFPELREMALSANAKKLGLDLPQDRTIVFGVVMDMDLDGTTITVVGFQTGDASIYLSSGGGFIGGSGQPEIRQAALNLVKTGQSFLDKAQLAKDKVVPQQGWIRFNLLTNRGLYTAQEKRGAFDDGSSPWTDLFGAAQEVITQYRIFDEKNAKKNK